MVLDYLAISAIASIHINHLYLCFDWSLSINRRKAVSVGFCERLRCGAPHGVIVVSNKSLMPPAECIRNTPTSVANQCSQLALATFETLHLHLLKVEFVVRRSVLRIYLWPMTLARSTSPAFAIVASASIDESCWRAWNTASTSSSNCGNGSSRISSRVCYPWLTGCLLRALVCLDASNLPRSAPHVQFRLLRRRRQSLINPRSTP